MNSVDLIHTVLDIGCINMIQNDTIAAIATGMQHSGIGIIRISGMNAEEIADKIFRNTSEKRLSDYQSHTIHYGFIYDNDVLIDEVMLTIMRAPRSFTTENTIEINCHGGILILKKILELVIKNGARPAEPGEFTKRAFLNGRIDLSKAEAVIDLIQAKNEFAMKNSIGQLRGFLFNKIVELREKVLFEVAFIESALDDPEHISLEGYSEKLTSILDCLEKDIDLLLESFYKGKQLKEGIKTVIVGKPNVGKSSLLNILIGEEKAIVTNIAGTTRDILEENILINGIGLQLLDTAGIRETEDIIEKIGVSKAIQIAGEADLILYIVDASIPLDENDEQIIEIIKNKETIILLNKTDLISVVNEEELEKKVQKKVISVSAKEHKGLELFEKELENMFINKIISYNDQVFITNIRQKNAIEEAKESLQMVRQSISNNLPEDFYFIDLMNAYTCLGKVIGENIEEDLVNEIFSKFCVGK